MPNNNFNIIFIEAAASIIFMLAVTFMFEGETRYDILSLFSVIIIPTLIVSLKLYDKYNTDIDEETMS